MAASGARSDWFDDYAERVTALVEDTGRVGVGLARQWGERSLADREWTVDTMTADAIAAWDELTPLAERGLGLWLEGVQRALRRGQA